MFVRPSRPYVHGTGACVFAHLPSPLSQRPRLSHPAFFTFFFSDCQST
ncbi:hypothetical protein, conserved [Leishmania donovani]|uniref:Uncharacterized protein n=1 Tax=Leishmania donovani TaxID=5661 RepID=E9BL31_LEIDO|nr:hypothetical protein, conserved [Leishmania donovani]CBZ35959.1 hypothetical protein, conserved [Leishmania donovani]